MHAVKRFRALALTVAEVDDILESLIAAREVKDLSGRQRQKLEEAHGSIQVARRAANGGVVLVPAETLVEVLRCATMTQQWLSRTVREMFAEDEND